MEHIAAHFLEFTAEHVFASHLGKETPTYTDTAPAAAPIRRLPPLAQQAVAAEPARAVRTFAIRHLQRHLPKRSTAPYCCPWATDAVRRRVGEENVAGIRRRCRRTQGARRHVG
ncbi:hypothetical protein [Streptomyces sp. NPDC018833]|uniref:hypothetical protein n=1 Tax=Streptomyces sp. NPDC018833 TaxID=3365053 RepID=UPI003794079C